MHFEERHIYLIFNQRNNRQSIFFNRKNYLFFLEKIRTHLLPFGDIFAYCLMPNHFHIMMQVNTLVVDHATIPRSATLSRAPRNSCTPKTTNLNKEIGILLASYTRAINNQNAWVGSIFRQKTKAECLTKQNGITPSFYDTEQGTKMHIPNSNYPQNCFNYIHQNPVKAGFVKKPIDWEFSSYQDYYGNRNDNNINIAATKKAGIII